MIRDVIKLMMNDGWTACDGSPLAFVNVAGITDPVQRDAVKQLVLDLQGYGIWDKFEAIYPFVGGTADSHSYNLKNTCEYQMTWHGSVTHDADGMTGNGTTGYGNMHLDPSTDLIANDTHLSIYCLTTDAALQIEDIGSTLHATSAFSFRIIWFTDILMYMNNPSNPLIVANADARGFYVATRTTSSDAECYKNGSSVVSLSTGAAGTLPDLDLYIGAVNTSGGAAGFSGRTYAFASIGAGLTDTEAANFYTAVQTFQTTLGRQV